MRSQITTGSDKPEIVFGIQPGLRVSRRLNDGNLQARVVHGNGVALMWAPDGPGWPQQGTDWNQAQQACQYLTADGLTILPSPQHIWRLPTVDEAERSMARHGQSSGGVWDAQAARATYQTTPDQESPLRNVQSRVIYWWTVTELDAERAYIVVYDGRFGREPKTLVRTTWGFDA